MVKQNHLIVFGTFEEVNFALSKTIINLDNKNQTLPYLLKYYKNNYTLVNTSFDITKIYNDENNLTEEQSNLLKEALFKD